MQFLAWTPFDWFWEIISLIPKLIYFLCVTLMSLLDTLQLVMRKLAGLDTYYVGEDATAQTGDIALSFLRNIFVSDSAYPAIKNAFWALVIFAVILLIVTTIIATIRQEYMPDADSAKEKPSNNKLIIISKSIKSLFLFLIVPVSCIFGLFLSDILLMALDSATTGGETGGTLFKTEYMDSGGEMQNVKNLLVQGEAGNGQMSYVYYDIFYFYSPATTTTSFSGLMFKTAAYNANRFRQNNTYWVIKEDLSTENLSFFQLSQRDRISNFQIFDTGADAQACAQLVDEAFANNIHLKPTIETLQFGDGVDALKCGMVFPSPSTVTRFSKYDVALIWYYYDLWQFNFLIGFACFIIALTIFVKIAAALVKRIIEIVALFIISPPIIAVMPLDGGKAFNKWRENFLSKALSAYGAIIGMNLFFLIFPYLNDIKFFAETGTWSSAIYVINLIISTLFIIVGLTVVEGFVKLLSGLIGGEDAVAAGGELVEKTGDTLASAAKYTGAAAGFAVKATALPATIVGRTAGKVIGSKWQKAKKEELQHPGDHKFVGGVMGAGAKLQDFGTKVKSFGKHEGMVKEAESQWQGGGARQAFDSLTGSNEEFTKNMSEAYKDYQDEGGDKSYKDWKESSEGSMMEGLYAKQYIGQTFDEFKDKKGGYGEKAFREIKSQKSSEIMGTRASKVASWTADVLPLSNLAAFSTFPMGEIKKAFGRSNKMALQSMLWAFQGKSSKEIEKQETIKKYEDEEAAKARIHEKIAKSGKDVTTGGGGGNEDVKKLKQDVERLKREISKKPKPPGGTP